MDSDSRMRDGLAGMMALGAYAEMAQVLKVLRR